MSSPHLFDTSAVENSGVPSFASNGGIWDESAIVLSGVGRVQMFANPTTTYVDTEAGTLLTRNGVLAASELPCLSEGGSPSVQRKDIAALQEGGGGGASVFTDMDYELTAFALRQMTSRSRVSAMGRVIGSANPNWLATATSSNIDQTTERGTGPTGIQRIGAGDLRLHFLPGRAPSGGVLIAQVATPSLLMTGVALNKISETEYQMTTLLEGGGGAASALTDVDVNLAWLVDGPGHSVGRVVAMGRGDASADALIWADGNVNTTGGLNTTGTGLFSIALQAGRGNAPAETLVFFTPFGPLAASGLVTIAPEVQTETSLGLIVRKEQGGGGVSIPDDHDFVFLALALR